MAAKLTGEERCSRRSWTGYDYSSCPHKAKVERNGQWYCGRHDPEAVAAKRKARHAKWDAEWAAKAKGWAIAKAREVIADAAIAYVQEDGDGTGKAWDRLAFSVAALRKLKEK